MIDYELYCKIQDYHRTRHLNVAQIAANCVWMNARWLAGWRRTSSGRGG